MIVLAPSSVQEMCDFVPLGFDLAFKYRNPIMILSDGVIGQMMEKVELFEQRTRWTQEEVIKNAPWACTGRTKDRERNIITSLDLDPSKQEKHVEKLDVKYKKMEAEEVRFETFQCEDADYILVAFGSSARICQKAIDLGRAEGIKVGLVRPITLYPFPKKVLADLGTKVKGMLVVEMNLGQMIEDVQLAVGCKIPVEHFGRTGGIIPTPDEVIAQLKKKIIGG
jgi:2-oxoglutarate ferredoxin oxidoreductase subunit alpha